MHYLIIIIVILIIVVIQVSIFKNTESKIKIFTGIFPSKNKDCFRLERETLIEKINSAKDDELEKMVKTASLTKSYYYSQIAGNNEWIQSFRREDARKDLISKLASFSNGISTNYKNTTLNTIIDSINDYLKNNRSVSDFHLMKDIVDRNCDALEEEISTQIPIPLYMGLVGTMAGILIGILYLWLSGGIGDLLNTGGGSGADGVEALLGGVALAMISSICGIIITTLGSNKFKTAKSNLESNKHIFLSWIQVKLLPTLSDNVVGAIREMTKNLNGFNKEFAANTGSLGIALNKVNESYVLQTQLLDSVRKIADKDISHQNLLLYNALKNSTTEIGTLSLYLQNCNNYLNTVKSLNDKLDLNETRTRSIEEMGLFFKTELSEIESRKGVMSKAVGTVDDYLKQALDKLKENAETQLIELQKSSIKQQDILKSKTEEINIIVSELKNLSKALESMKRLENATNEQTRKLENLSIAITALSIVKTDGSSIPNLIAAQKKRTKWVNILIWLLSVISGLILLIMAIANWDSIYSKFIVLFRF